MTLQELREEVRQNIHQQSGSIADERITDYINWAQQEIAQIRTFSEMLTSFSTTTVAATQCYNHPVDVKEIYSLVLIDGANSRKLRQVSPRGYDYDVPYPENTTQGRPAYYIDYGDNFELYPIPDDAYSLEARCAVYPSDLSDDSDESDLEKKDALIVALASAYGARAIHEFQMAQYYENQVAARLLAHAIKADSKKPDWQPVGAGFGPPEGTSTDPENPFLDRNE